MSGIDQIAGVLQGLNTGLDTDIVTGGANAFGTGSVPFAGVLQQMVQQTSHLSKKADDAVTGLLNGSGVEVHDAMIAGQKSSMAFELALQVRNKAVGAYQSMMAMQF